MAVSRTWCVAALVAAFAASAAEPPAEDLTWQEANKRSAALLKKDVRSKEGADLARLAFDLYPIQAREYKAPDHAQLLLNLVHALWNSSETTTAIAQLEGGIDAIAQRTGRKDPVLIDLWRQGAAMSGSRAKHYYGEAMAVAESTWGPDDSRTLDLALNMAHELRRDKGYAWARSRTRSIRERAAKSGEDSKLVAECDLILAKLEMEVGNKDKAAEAFEALVTRLEKRPDREQEHSLMVAYGMLEYLYEERHDRRAAREIRERRLQWHEQHPHVASSPGAPDPGRLTPLSRVVPEYPRQASARGREGFVDFQVDVNPDGTVADLKVLQSEPPGVFDKAASRAIRKWKFQPKYVDGKAVASSGRQRIEFKLKNRD